MIVITKTVGRAWFGFGSMSKFTAFAVSTSLGSVTKGAAGGTGDEVHDEGVTGEEYRWTDGDANPRTNSAAS